MAFETSKFRSNIKLPSKFQTGIQVFSIERYIDTQNTCYYLQNDSAFSHHVMLVDKDVEPSIGVRYDVLQPLEDG